MRNRAWFPFACGAAWLGVVVTGLAGLWHYESLPGARLAVPAGWPSDSHISRVSGEATLVMFAHPRCPCTRASIGELEKIMAQSHGPVRAHVVFYKPHGTPDEWARTDLWRSAAAIPGVDVRADEDGLEAAKFGAVTSGFVVLYDGLGHLGYNGGITAARGHAGDSEGQDAIVAILNSRAPRLTAMPVFGCSFSDPESKCVKGIAWTK